MTRNRRKTLYNERKNNKRRKLSLRVKLIPELKFFSENFITRISDYNIVNAKPFSYFMSLFIESKVKLSHFKYVYKRNKCDSK
jgi:hypothetical protein